MAVLYLSLEIALLSKSFVFNGLDRLLVNMQDSVIRICISLRQQKLEIIITKYTIRTRKVINSQLKCPKEYHY